MRPLRATLGRFAPKGGEGDIVDCKRALDNLGDLARSAYGSYFVKAIHHVPLGYAQSVALNGVQCLAGHSNSRTTRL
jgi:hypothetical protein